MIRIFRHYIPRSLVLLMIAEMGLLVGIPYLGVTAPGFGAAAADSPDTFQQAVVFGLVMYVAMVVMGLYWQGSCHDWGESLWRVMSSFVLGSAAAIALGSAVPGLLPEWHILMLVSAIVFISVLLTRSAYYVTAHRLHGPRRVLVLGTGQKAHEVERICANSKWQNDRIVGYIGNHENCAISDTRKIMSSPSSLVALVELHKVDEIVVAPDDRRKTLPLDEILECKMRGVEVLEAGTFVERRAGKINLRAAYPSAMIFSDGFRKTKLSMATKRVFDVAAAIGVLLVAWPVMAITALAIVIESGFRGPVLYRQERVGKGGRSFDVIKFRSMCVNAEKDGAPQWAKMNDARVTRVGRIIRKYRIDELPQLVNVIRGDMSFVGPRPERPQFVERLAKEIQFYNLRHYVKPGITGWAQICYPYGDSVKDAMKKLEYDLYYIKNYSLFMDITILLQTAQAVLWGKGGR